MLSSHGGGAQDNRIMEEQLSRLSRRSSASKMSSVTRSHSVSGVLDEAGSYSHYAGLQGW